MAITIKVEPQEITPAYNEVIVVLDSTNKAEPKFQYVVDINVGGVFSSRLKIQSNPQGFGVVNLAKHLEPYVSSNLDLADKEAFKKIEDSYQEYDITLSEEYVLTTSFTSVTDNGGFCQYNYATPHNFIDEDFVTVSGSSVPAYDGVQEVTAVPSNVAIVTTEVFSATATGDTVLSNNTVTIIPDAAVFTGDKYVINNVLNWVDVPNWDVNDYIVDSSAPAQFLTNINNTIETGLEDRITFNLYNKNDNEARYLKVSSDNRGTFFYDNNFPISSATTKMLSVGVGAFDIINAPLSGTVASSVLPVIDGETTYYTVELMDDSFNTSSEVYTFNIDRRCKRFDGFRLMYLNTGGSFSTFDFPLAHSKTTTAKKTNFRQNYGSYDSAAVSYGWNSYDIGTKRIDTDIDEVYDVTSDYVSENYGSLMEDLIKSPEVYHLTDNTPAYDTSVNISNFTGSDGDLVTIETATNHDLSIGDCVLLNSVSIPSYNIEHTVTEVINLTTFKINKTVVGSLPFPTGTAQKRIFGSDGVLRAIEIQTNSVKVKQRLTDGLINYKLKFKYSNKNKVQR